MTLEFPRKARLMTDDVGSLMVQYFVIISRDFVIYYKWSKAYTVRGTKQERCRQIEEPTRREPVAPIN